MGSTSVDVRFLSPVVGAQNAALGHFRDDASFHRFAACYRSAAALLPSASSHSIETSYGVVRAYSFGEEHDDRAPLLLLAGRNGSAPMWAPALPALLAGRRQVVAIDSVGEPGCSSQTAPLESRADQAAWLAEVVESLELGSVHLVGQSMGGWVATCVAQHRPDVVATLTVLDPPSTFAPLRRRFLASGIGAAVVPSGSLRRRLLGWIVGGGEPADVAPETAHTLAELGATGLETFRVRQPPPQRPRRDDLAAIDVPRLAVLAGRSRVHDAALAAECAASTGWRVEEWPEVGHDVASHAARLASTVLDFVDEA